MSGVRIPPGETALVTFNAGTEINLVLAHNEDDEVPLAPVAQILIAVLMRMHEDEKWLEDLAQWMAVRMFETEGNA